MKWQIAPADGGKPLRLDSDGGRESNIRDDKSWTDIEGLEVEEAGDYDVQVAEVAGGPDPALTFGTSGVTPAALIFIIAGVGIGTTLIAGALVMGRR